jgi:uncharacterized NAD(P)/FAD-binding protein YdhS
MSAFPSEPSHFLDWLHRRGVAAEAGGFVERRLYGLYLYELLQAEIRNAQGRLRFAQGDAADIGTEGSTLLVHLADGRTHSADAVVLATGHPLPAPPVPLDRGVLDSERYRANPWDGAAVEGLTAGSDLLLIGSGLTAVDVLLQAREKGFRGTARVLSRRGLLPLAHGMVPSPPTTEVPDLGERRVRAMIRVLREAVEEGAARGIDWRLVFDSLRPRTQELWKSLPIAERRRFLRHARPYWEVHRHRLAPEVMGAIEREIASGTLVRHAGRILSVRVAGAHLGVAVRPRGRGADYTLHVQRIVNCTGPNTGVEMFESPLTRSLLAKRLVRADDLGIGLACDPDGALIDAMGNPSRQLFTLGSLRKGELWESTAVPELRVQAERLAARLAE